VHGSHQTPQNFRFEDTCFEVCIRACDEGGEHECIPRSKVRGWKKQSICNQRYKRRGAFSLGDRPLKDGEITLRPNTRVLKYN